MLITPDNWRDVQRYYQNTFIKMKEFGDKLFFVREVGPKGMSGLHGKGGDEVFFFHFSHDTPYELDYILPNKSMFQMGNDAHLLYRVPFKQYSRGISEDNTRMVCPRNEKGTPVTWTSLEAYVEKQAFFSLKTALFNPGKYRSMALNSRMCYNKDAKTIILDTKPIASYDGTTFQCLEGFKSDIQMLINQDPFEVVLK